MKHFSCLKLHRHGSLLLDEVLIQHAAPASCAPPAHRRQLAGQAAALPGGRGQLRLEPVGPLTAVALVDKVCALEQVAGSSHDGCLWQVEEGGDQEGVGYSAGDAGLQQEVEPVHPRLNDVDGNHVTLQNVTFRRCWPSRRRSCCTTTGGYAEVVPRGMYQPTKATTAAAAADATGRHPACADPANDKTINSGSSTSVVKVVRVASAISRFFQFHGFYIDDDAVLEETTC